MRVHESLIGIVHPAAAQIPEGILPAAHTNSTFLQALVVFCVPRITLSRLSPPYQPWRSASFFVSHPLRRCSPFIVAPIGPPPVLCPVISLWKLCSAKQIQNGCTLNLLEEDHDESKSSLLGFRTLRLRITLTRSALFAPPTRCSQLVSVRPVFTRSLCGVYGS
jgi:hypothetical protein